MAISFPSHLVQREGAGAGLVAARSGGGANGTRQDAASEREGQGRRRAAAPLEMAAVPERGKSSGGSSTSLCNAGVGVAER